jgi:hypothetical protein
MSEDSSEASALSRVINKLQANGPFGENEGEARAKVIESGIRTPNARNLLLAALISLSTSIAIQPLDKTINEELARDPNPQAQERLDALQTLEDDILLPTMASVNGQGQALLAGLELLSHVELLGEVIVDDLKD